MGKPAVKQAQARACKLVEPQSWALVKELRLVVEKVGIEYNLTENSAEMLAMVLIEVLAGQPRFD